MDDFVNCFKNCISGISCARLRLSVHLAVFIGRAGTPPSERVSALPMFDSGQRVRRRGGVRLATHASAHDARSRVGVGLGSLRPSLGERGGESAHAAAAAAAGSDRRSGPRHLREASELLSIALTWPQWRGQRHLQQLREHPPHGCRMWDLPLGGYFVQ